MKVITTLLSRLRGKRESRVLRLREVMRRRGAMLPEPLTSSAVRDAALAARRCAECNHQAMCDELLRAGRSTGYGLFCPNAHYIEQLRKDTLSFD